MKKVSDSLTFKYRGLIGVICLFPKFFVDFRNKNSV